jgi:hypothetical protein
MLKTGFALAALANLCPSYRSEQPAVSSLVALPAGECQMYWQIIGGTLSVHCHSPLCACNEVRWQDPWGFVWHYCQCAGGPNETLCFSRWAADPNWPGGLRLVCQLGTCLNTCQLGTPGGAQGPGNPLCDCIFVPPPF